MALYASGTAHAPGVIHNIVARQQQLRDRDDVVAVLQQVLDHGRERLGRMLRGVVEQDDAAGPDAAFDALRDLPGGELLPVEAVPTGNTFKGSDLSVSRKKTLSAIVLNHQMHFQTGTDQIVNRPQPIHERHIQRTEKTVCSFLQLVLIRSLFLAPRLVI